MQPTCGKITIGLKSAWIIRIRNHRALSKYEAFVISQISISFLANPIIYIYIPHYRNENPPQCVWVFYLKNDVSSTFTSLTGKLMTWEKFAQRGALLNKRMKANVVSVYSQLQVQQQQMSNRVVTAWTAPVLIRGWLKIYQAIGHLIRVNNLDENNFIASWLNIRGRHFIIGKKL